MESHYKKTPGEAPERGFLPIYKRSKVWYNVHMKQIHLVGLLFCAAAVSGALGFIVVSIVCLLWIFKILGSIIYNFDWDAPSLP